MQIFLYLRNAFVLFVIIEFIVTCYYTFLAHRSNSMGFGNYFSIQDLDNYTGTLEYLWRPNGTDLHNSSDRIAAQLAWTKHVFKSQRIKNMKRKKILLVHGLTWGKFWSTNNRINCPGFTINSKKCKLTISKNLREKNLSPGHYDAMIYTHDYKPHPRRSIKIPDHVKQVVYNEECPYILPKPMSFPKNSLSASYYRGSDIVLPYSKWVPYGSNESKHFNVKPPKKLSPLKDYSKGKTGLVVVFNSHCGNVPSGRSQYIKELKKYISIDIFGKCGVRPPCNNNTGNDECLSSVVRKYKFYLSFENSNCRDYITEKFFSNALKNDVVPVVLGAHPDDYTYAAPPNSYISTQDFKGPKELAKYLIALDKNSTRYNEYFRWKGTGTFYHAWQDLFCRLCGLLFYADFVPPQFWKEGTTWDKVDHCLPRGHLYWNRTK